MFTNCRRTESIFCLCDGAKDWRRCLNWLDPLWAFVSEDTRVMATYINFQTLYKCFTNIACIIYQRTILYKVLPSVQRHGYHTNIRAFQIFRFSNIFLFSVQIFEKVNNFKSWRGCRAVVGKGSFSLNLTDGSLEKVARMHQFLWRFPRTVGGRTGATNWWKTSQNDRKQISKFASGWVVGYFNPNWSKIWESFLPYMGIICFHNILRFGYEAPLRVGYNKVTRGVNTHTEEKLCWQHWCQ